MANLRDAIIRIWEEENNPLDALWNWAQRSRDEDVRHERWVALERWAGSHKRDEDHDSEEFKAWQQRQRIYRARARATKGDDKPEVPGMESGGWHPEARRVQVQDGIGPLIKPVAGVLHCTQGFGLPIYNGTNPHFTLEPKAGTLYQHQSVFEGARALENDPGGVETNRKCIQIEIIAFSEQAQNWSDPMYENIADLMRWIEDHCGVKRTFDDMVFPGGGQIAHMTNSKWLSYQGWCGHCNVPENAHWDPGRIIKDKLV